MLKRMHIILLVTGIFLWIGCEAQKESPKLPNIIFILVDDMGYTQVGCNGSGYYQTPNIDQLASEGMRFTGAYAAASICSPTRASIMTGKYPARLHITDFIPGRKNKEEQRVIQPEWQKYLPLEEVTIAEILKEKGYSTAIFGKWHLSQEKLPPASLPYNPSKQGFNESFVTYKPSRKNRQAWQDAENDAHNIDTITNRALNFLERNKSNPFFLFVSHNVIHNPLAEKAKTIEKYEKLKASKKPKNTPVIAAMIEHLDNSSGKIFQKVSDLGLEDNTIIIFYSDNGGLESDADQTPLKAGKGWLYEGGIKVPLIVKWKGLIQPNTTSKSLVSSIDFLPTLLEVAGVKEIPESVDGESLVTIFKKPASQVHETLFWHYPHYNEPPPCGAVRHGDWKLIEWYDKTLLNEKENVFELYNLINDPGETINLANTQKDITEELSNKLRAWRKDVNAQMPFINENYLRSK
jgi:arylsulfatase A